MPLKRCTKNGQQGWKFGDKGACYTGPGGKAKAIKQALAEVGGDSEKLKQELSKAGLLEDPVVQAFLADLEPKGSDAYLSAAASYFESQLAPDDDLAVAYVSAEERKKMPLSDFADPKRRAFPINNQAHLDAAVKLVGRESPSKQTAIKARIKEIAKRKGLKLPDSWK